MEFRKTDLPAHIKAKHMPELAKHLVDDAKTSSSNVICSYLRGACPKTMPIPSRLYEGADYWFGAKPIMIEEKDNVTPYLAVDMNVQYHRQFVKELMDYVSLNDYMEINRKIQVRSPEMVALQENNKALRSQIHDLEMENTKELSRLHEELETYKQTVEDVNEGITHRELQQQIKILQRECASEQRKNEHLSDDLETLKWKYEQLQKEYNNMVENKGGLRDMATIELEEGYLKHIEVLQKTLQKERDKVAQGKKEAKDSDKKKEEKERMKAELKAAKAKAKALARQLENSDSDSD